MATLLPFQHATRDRHIPRIPIHEPNTAKLRDTYRRTAPWNHTIPYSKEENGIVERANKEINRHIRNILADKELVENWHCMMEY